MFLGPRPPGARYRDLRNRLRRLEAIYEDSVKLDRVISTGRYYKLAVATARAHELIEREFDWRRPVRASDDKPPKPRVPPHLERRRN